MFLHSFLSAPTVCHPHSYLIMPHLFSLCLDILHHQSSSFLEDLSHSTLTSPATNPLNCHQLNHSRTMLQSPLKQQAFIILRNNIITLYLSNYYLSDKVWAKPLSLHKLRWLPNFLIPFKIPFQPIVLYSLPQNIAHFILPV